ncbi:LuxR C-terminal-related transcriptional regulator [Nocardioides sp.]|uniref:helix-turn-helix transcriptional regulator n=1 Tax=Nocardioides sp. TaxID=35761 RepID=UPI00286DCA8C|nr:helix-turn-helix domain-containing protein [Nocardioides sp.]
MSRRPLADAFGLPARIDELYRQVLSGSGGSLQALAASLFVAPHELVRQLAPLLELDIVRIDGDLLSVASPVDAVSRYVAGQAATVAEVGAQLSRLAAALPVLAELGGDTPELDSTAIDGEISIEADVPKILVAWIGESPGDLRFLRPDQWRLPSESEMALAVNTAVQAGRRVRAIYPARVLQEAPAILIGRAAIGEQIRVLPEVPTRMAIIGATRAMLPEPLGVGNQRRILIRQQAIVQVLTAWFDELWDSATAVTTLDRGEARPDLRRLLLAQLAAGGKDEQIARTLNISLRTVRRRIAALMSDLGVDTRFQAGVEAARRGWL